MTAFAQHRVPHLRGGFIVAKVGIERTGVPNERSCSLGWKSETALANLHTETSKVEVD
jgi:hypothetical protein